MFLGPRTRVLDNPYPVYNNNSQVKVQRLIEDYNNNNQVRVQRLIEEYMFMKVVIHPGR